MLTKFFFIVFPRWFKKIFLVFHFLAKKSFFFCCNFNYNLKKKLQPKNLSVRFLEIFQHFHETFWFPTPKINKTISILTTESEKIDVIKMKSDKLKLAKIIALLHSAAFFFLIPQFFVHFDTSAALWAIFWLEKHSTKPQTTENNRCSVFSLKLLVAYSLLIIYPHYFFSKSLENTKTICNFSVNNFFFFAK